MTMMPELDSKVCDSCGLCLIACHAGGIVKRENKVEVIETQDCDFCGVCEAVCPLGAIKCVYTIGFDKE